MFGWVGRVWSGVKGIPGDVATLIQGVEHAIIGWALNIFHLVGASWHDLAKGVHFFVRLGDDFGTAVVAFAHRVVHVYLPQLEHWAAHELGNLLTRVENLAANAWRWVEHATAKAWRDLQDALDWIHVHIWTPLRNDLNDIQHWIAHGAADAVALITHPGKLLDLLSGVLGGWLRANVDQLLHDVVRYVRTSILGDTQWFARRVESVLTDLL